MDNHKVLVKCIILMVLSLLDNLKEALLMVMGISYGLMDLIIMEKWLIIKRTIQMDYINQIH
jgi:hypothetical protein